MRKISFANCTAPGMKGVNEDSVAIIRKNGLYAFVVADGLGGHEGGSSASALAVSRISSVLEGFRKPCVKLLRQCFEQAQQAVLQLGKGRTTLVLMVTDGKKAVWGHIGDSRLYHFRRGKLLSRTVDHSVPQMLLSLGQITPAELAHHGDRNRLTAAVGSGWERPMYAIDRKPRRLRRNDRFLLCSDGFWRELDEKEAGAAMGVQAAHKALDSLTGAVTARASEEDRDDTTAIVISID